MRFKSVSLGGLAMKRLRITPVFLLTAAIFAAGILPEGAFSARYAGAADFWSPANNPGIGTTNDCGVVSFINGGVSIKRSFQTQEEKALHLGLADRIHSGDILETQANGRLEWTSGNNIVVTLGMNSRVRLNGLRTFSDNVGNPSLRLDLTLLSGEMRIQVRLNTDRPEAVLAGLSGTEILVKRGDACLVEGGQWRAALLSGEAWGRAVRGGLNGVPFKLEAERLVGSAGENTLTGKDIAGIKTRLPFSFETERLARQPEPSMGDEPEAP